MIAYVGLIKKLETNEFHDNSFFFNNHVDNTLKTKIILMQNFCLYCLR